MARIYSQAPEELLSASTALDASASIAGSLASAGHSRLVGIIWSNASAVAGAGSGLHIRQSADYGQHWDIVTASYTITASAASAFSASVYGNAVQVIIWNGATAASLFRASFRLYPI